MYMCCRIFTCAATHTCHHPVCMQALGRMHSGRHTRQNQYIGGRLPTMTRLGWSDVAEYTNNSIRAIPAQIRAATKAEWPMSCCCLTQCDAVVLVQSALTSMQNTCFLLLWLCAACAVNSTTWGSTKSVVGTATPATQVQDKHMWLPLELYAAMIVQLFSSHTGMN